MSGTDGWSDTKTLAEVQGRNSPVPGRDRYLDLLRTVALVRVVAYHTFGGVFFSFLFPSMGVMFALAGSLMARSLNRPAGDVIKSRTRRLLIPLWVYSVTIIVLLFLHGWRPGQQGTGSVLHLLLWFLPIADPIYPQTAGDGTGLLYDSWSAQTGMILWYVRAYFWFMLLSPLLLKMYRARPLRTLLAPLVLMVLLAPGFVPLPGATAQTLTDFAVYGSCWMLGFAYHDGHLRRVPHWIVFTAGPAVMALGVWWAATHPTQLGWDLNEIPLAQALWSFGFTAMLFRISPNWQVLPRPLRFLDRFVTLTNNRAMTIYLWHNLLLVLTVPLINPLYSVGPLWETVPWLLSSPWLQFVLVWLMLGGVFLAVGWTEDVAARRRPRPWPDGSRPEPPRTERRKKQPVAGTDFPGWLWLYPRSFREEADRAFLAANTEASSGSAPDAPRDPREP